MGKISQILEGLYSLTHKVDTFEMANLKAERSGLPYDVWLDSSGSERKVSHNLPRVKVIVKDGKKESRIPIILYPDGHAEVDKHFSKNFKYSKELVKWVEDNKDTITKHWNKEIDDYDALGSLFNTYRSN